MVANFGNFKLSLRLLKFNIVKFAQTLTRFNHWNWISFLIIMKKITQIFKVFIFSVFVLQAMIFPQSPQNRFPVKRIETPETWKINGRSAIQRAKNKPKFNSRAKNVILFIGDGMGISTLTASRILEGQMRGESGEENLLSFEQFPYSALSRTYTANQQTPDSAPTMSAIVSGVKNGRRSYLHKSKRHF